MKTLMQRLTALVCSTGRHGQPVTMIAGVAFVGPITTMLKNTRDYNSLLLLDLTKHAICGSCAKALSGKGVTMTPILTADTCLAGRIAEAKPDSRLLDAKGFELKGAARIARERAILLERQRTERQASERNGQERKRRKANRRRHDAIVLANVQQTIAANATV